MAKLNVHTASRDELRDAGVRADLIDEIMKRRRRKGGVTLEALDEVPGVGPATLEQLSKALDFTQPLDKGAEADNEPRPPRGERSTGDDKPDVRDNRPPPASTEPVEEVADKAEATLRAGTEQAADLVAATIGASEDVTSRATEAAARIADQGARVGLQAVEQTAEIVAGAQNEVTQHPVQDASAFGQAFLELLQEQGRENLEAMTALSRAKGLDEVIKVQGAYLRGTLERMTELNRRWLALAGTRWPDVPPWRRP